MESRELTIGEWVGKLASCHSAYESYCKMVNTMRRIKRMAGNDSPAAWRDHQEAICDELDAIDDQAIEPRKATQ